ncbi:TrmH family RNA methyltransferase [Aureitalea marina]|uniref:tRNA (guanosine(18)-2'-O)-methyltransferase n=1 Tax=Aureitalea marina TaxID=930804 RepID=A0A2S7KPK3_9FLAO|nr:RNA methyltransferase [Aureitalea marina]PQB04564.1 rRNA methyltransferase [Aureitalea marina]
MNIELFEHLQSFLTERRQTLLRQKASERTRFITVVMEDLYQAHNTSAVMRSCDVFGVQDLHLIERRFGKRMDREIAMGAQKWVDLHRYQSTHTCLDQLRSKGYKLVATSPHQSSVDLSDFKLEQPIALIFGTEKEGISQEVLDRCDECLKIPMYGFTESLNVSVSAAIILYQLSQQLRDHDLPWKLAEEEQLQLIDSWMRRSIKSVDQIIQRFEESKNS